MSTCTVLALRIRSLDQTGNRGSLYQINAGLWLFNHEMPNILINNLLLPTTSGTRGVLTFGRCFHVLLKENILSIQIPINLNLPYFNQKMVSTDSLFRFY